jgi:hypothetical protein
MQAHISYAFHAHEPTDLLELSTAYHRHCKICEAHEPTENFPPALGKADVIRMAPQAHKRSVEIQKEETLVGIPNACDHLRPRGGQVTNILRCPPLTG